ncbi:MAG TPA: carboxypeptidase-like regulatory domain-containing protein [Terriglobales bacterium]|nr:carboxypeptidase-like regulatory domain-containing protein [Terriglobales bacterium]
MKSKAARTAIGVGILVFLLLLVESARAQVSGAALTGTITDSSGAGVPNARISVRSLDTSQLTTTQSNPAGLYSLSNLTPGEYEVSISADGFATQSVKTTLTGGVSVTLNTTLTAQGAQNAPISNLPNAPSSTKPAPSLEDLGFTPEQVQGNTKEQALLDKRTHMLKIHQRLGLITTAPLIATLVTSIGAGGRHTSNTDRTVHMVLGSATADLYFTTAYFAIRAPRVRGTETRGPIRFHKAMAWIHGPGMILTPIFGAVAYSQKNNGEKVHGVGAAHGPVAIVTAGAFGAALLAVSVKF